MKLIRNLTTKPIRIPLSGGKVLHLAPAKTGQVSDQAVERPALRKLVEQGEIEIVGDGRSSSAGQDAQSSVHESTHGHPQPKVVFPKGNR